MSGGLRLFFALWPAPDEAEALLEAAAPALAACRARPVPAERLHLTLAFLGRADEGQLAAVHEAADRLVAPRLGVTLEAPDCWRRPQALIARPMGATTELVAAAARLWQLLGEVGFEPETRPYRPHVTLARKVRAEPAEGLPRLTGPVSWRHSEFVLVNSVSGPQGLSYHIIGRWPLG